MTVTVRWAKSTDAAFAFVAEHVPSDVVASRIAARCIAIAELDGQPVGALQLEYLWHRHMGFVECGFLAGVNSGGVGEVFFVKSLTPGQLV
jgi:hypothetical protein